jgi:hypothetical protein
MDMIISCLSAGLLKRCVSIALVLALALSLIASPAWSRVEVRNELRTDGFVFGRDLIIAAPQQTLFHQRAETDIDSESASVSFPGSVPLSQDGSTDLALPSISQRVGQTSNVVDTGFFTANYCYCPGPNDGNVPLTSTYLRDLSMIKPGRLIGSAPMYSEMVNTAPGERKLSELARQANNTSGQGMNKSLSDQIKRQLLLNLPANITSDSSNMIKFSERECPTCVGPSITPPSIGIGTGSTGQTGSGISKNESATPAAPQGYDLTYEHFNLSADTATIENMSVTDRMWRNAHIGGMMWTAYQGDTATPAWISPFDKPQTIVQMTDHFQVIRDSLNMTKDGTTIKPRFWRL